VIFTAGGVRPYDPADQGMLPPWFANSAQAAAVTTLINDFVFRCGSFLATNNVVEASGAKPVHAYLFAQSPIYSSEGSTACAPFPADPNIQNAARRGTRDRAPRPGADRHRPRAWQGQRGGTARRWGHCVGRVVRYA
jgi:hypothetical protein